MKKSQVNQLQKDLEITIRVEFSLIKGLEKERLNKKAAKTEFFASKASQFDNHCHKQYT